MEPVALSPWLNAERRFEALATLLRSGTLRPLRPRAWAVLFVVAAEGSPKLVQIEAATGFSRSTVKRAIADLRAIGLIRRGPPLTRGLPGR